MKTAPLRAVADVWSSNVDKHAVKGEMPVQLCNYTNVYYGDTVAPHPDLMWATASASQIARNKLLIGDTVLTKDSEDPGDIGISATVTSEADDFVCGYHLAIARPLSGSYPRYLTWVLRSRPVLDYFSNAARGISRYGLGLADLRATPIPLHTPEDQRRIADFLDERVARIDQIVAARRTQHLHNREMGDHAWLRATRQLGGELVPIRRFLRSITDGPFGSSLTSQHYADTGTRVIRLGNLGLGEFRGADRAYIPDDYAAALAQHAVRPGDLIMAGLGDETWPLGRSAVVPDDFGPAIVKADCYRIRLDERVDHHFAALALSSPDSRVHIKQMSRGSTRARLNTELARAIPIPFVPPEKQRLYIRQVAELRRAVAARAAELERSAALMSEYKQSLITAAVTGEFDVTTASTRIPGEQA